MDITPLPPTDILSHHSHLSLLPSPFARRGQPSSTFTPTAYPRPPFTSYGYRRRHVDTRAPLDGSSPIGSLPDEILLHIFGFLDWDDVLPLRRVNTAWASLALAPSLHHTLTLTALPPTPLPEVLSKHILPAVRHLHLHLFPYPASCQPWKRDQPMAEVLELLNAIPAGQLLSISLPFSAPYLPSADTLAAISRLGGRLEKLDLRGSGLAGRSWLLALEHLGPSGRRLKELDLGFTNITALPPTTAPAWKGLTSLSLASCSYLPSTELAAFLADLPPSLVRLDLSRLDQVSFEALWDMRVTAPDGHPTALREVKVVGIDHLTRLDIRRLKLHWASQRRPADADDPDTPCRLAVSRAPPIPIRSSVSRTPSPAGRGYSTSPASSTSSSSSASSTGPQTPPDWSSHARLLGAVRSPARSLERASATASKNAVEGIQILHSAILESEDEAGYRQFIGEVVGGTVVDQGARAGWDTSHGDDGTAYMGISGDGIM